MAALVTHVNLTKYLASVLPAGGSFGDTCHFDQQADIHVFKPLSMKQQCDALQQSHLKECIYAHDEFDCIKFEIVTTVESWARKSGGVAKLSCKWAYSPSLPSQALQKSACEKVHCA